MTFTGYLDPARGLDVDLVAIAGAQARGQLRLEYALELPIPSGRDAGTTLREVAAHPNGRAWLAWAKDRPASYWPLEFELALEVVVRERFPDLLVDEERRAT